MSQKKAPCVDVRTDVHKDVRFEALGDLAGYNRFEAIGRMHALWSWCVDRGLKDAPESEDGYVVPEAVVCRFLGPRGCIAILGDDVDEFALGEVRENGRIYLRGTSEYVSDRRARVATSQAGGKARHELGSRDETGRFVNHNTNVQPATQPESSNTGNATALQPTANQPHPASSPSSSPSGSQTYIHARDRHPAAGRIVEAIWKLGSQRCTELKVANIPSVAPWPLMAGGENPGRLAVLDRVCELLVANSPEEAERIAINRVNVAHAKAMADLDGGYFAPLTMFTPNSFATWAHLDPKTLARKPAQSNRAPKSNGTIGASTPHKNFGEESKAAKEVM